jgi:RNA recognition motif-containing protein
MELDFKINLPKTQMTNPTPLKLSFILDFNNVDNKMTYTLSQNKAGKVNQINNSAVGQRNEIYINNDNIKNNNSINMTNIYSESNENIKELDKKDFDNKIQFTNNNINNNEKQKNDKSIRDISKSFKINKDLEAGEVIDLVNRNPKEKKFFNRENNDLLRGKNNNNNIFNNYNRNRRSFESRNNQSGKYEKLFLKDNDKEKDKEKEKFNYKKQIENIQIPENATDEIFVSGLSENTNKYDFKKLFYKYGKVVYYKIIKDKNTQKNKGIGFIKFEDIKSAVYAVNSKDEIICDGKKLNIKFKNKQSNYNNNEEKYKRNLLEKNLSKINETINLSNNSVSNEKLDEEDSWGVGSNYINDLERSRSASLNRSQNRSKSGSRSKSRSKDRSLIEKKDKDNNNSNNNNNFDQW